MRRYMALKQRGAVSTPTLRNDCCGLWGIGGSCLGPGALVAPVYQGELSLEFT
ncbi:hypothetical protein AB0C93_11755 [Streptomyces sp. NPDC048518]|uniref:hypothetical protein n=1 Tax=Streptomyces sp. NPDC048518 TaxID=3155029 RepID=UPI0033E78E60